MKIQRRPSGSSSSRTFSSRQQRPLMIGPKGLGIPRYWPSTTMFTCTETRPGGEQVDWIYGTKDPSETQSRGHEGWCWEPSGSLVLAMWLSNREHAWYACVPELHPGTTQPTNQPKHRIKNLSRVYYSQLPALIWWSKQIMFNNLRQQREMISRWESRITGLCQMVMNTHKNFLGIGIITPPSNTFPIYQKGTIPAILLLAYGFIIIFQKYV